MRDGHHHALGAKSDGELTVVKLWLGGTDVNGGETCKLVAVDNATGVTVAEASGRTETAAWKLLRAIALGHGYVI